MRHNSSTLTATHRVVSLDDIGQGQYDKHFLEKEEQICDKHHEALSIFCHTCSEAVCVHCAIAEHKKHQFDTVDEASDKRRESLKQALSVKITEKSSEVLEKGRRSFEGERRRRQRMLELVNSESERREEVVRVCQQVEEGGGLTLLLLSQTLQQG
ncbi:E3 ubiquitin-protein ligase TRIM39-like [Haliotis rubra]|uniref:E3 ubiquitin-protein ligase TRIM39-like n=1 Tax=Haliotis rubra TaxID=36100 RepID=UPI001EE54101|nr:E3 ubiquitin-protein ligase TRIM39-like [Haliotis rubra]